MSKTTQRSAEQLTPLAASATASPDEIARLQATQDRLRAEKPSVRGAVRKLKPSNERPFVSTSNYVEGHIDVESAKQCLRKLAAKNDVTLSKLFSRKSGMFSHMVGYTAVGPFDKLQAFKADWLRELQDAS